MRKYLNYDTLSLYIESLERRISALEKRVIEGKIDQKVLNDFLGDDYYDKYIAIKNKISNPEYKDVYKLIKKDPNVVKDYIDHFKSSRDMRAKSKEMGAKLIYSDDNWNVYRITTYDAAVLYGKNTKWCITGKYPGSEKYGEDYFNDYIKDYNLDGGYYFYINKHDPNLKYCVLQDRNKRIHSIWDATDKDLGNKFDLVRIKQDIILPSISEIPESSVEYDISDAVRMQDAIDNGNINNIITLVEDGVDPNVIIEDGLSALSYACIQQADEIIIETLIRHGADVDGAYSKEPPFIEPLNFAFIAINNYDKI